VNVFFDVDYTILSNRSLRPHTREVFEDLVARGHRVYVWSGTGDRTSELAELGLLPLLSGVYIKPIAVFDKGLIDLGVPVRPDFVIDDHPDIVKHFGGLVVSPYDNRVSSDSELLMVLRRIASLDEPEGEG
jgi:hypothetical protein